MPTALVTGATGLVGTHVAQRLRKDGWEVRALVRDPTHAGALTHIGVQLATGDILEPTSFASAARGCDVIVHTAAAVTAPGGWEAFRRPNIDGTRNAIVAAATAKARLVHVSSVAVYGNSARYGAPGQRTSEDTVLPPIPDHAFYARSKRESEELVMQAHRDGRVWATAVRPDVVYGRHDRQFVPRMAKLLQRGFAPIIGDGSSTLAVVHAENVADGIVRAAVSDVAGGRAYNLANDTDVTVAEFFRLAGVGMDVKVRMVRIPFGVAKGALGAFKLIAPMFLGSQFNAVTSASLDFLSRDNPFTSERARRELGWDPPVRPEIGIPDAFRWWRTHH